MKGFYVKIQLSQELEDKNKIHRSVYRLLLLDNNNRKLLNLINKKYIT